MPESGLRLVSGNKDWILIGSHHSDFTMATENFIM